MTLSATSFALLIVLVLAVGAVIGFLLGKSQANTALLETARDAAALREQIGSAEARANRLLEENTALVERSRSDADVMRALSPINKQLDLVNDHVRKLEAQTTSQHAEVVTQLRRDAQVSLELSETTASLNGALRSTTARGHWGEVQLRRIIEAAGMLEHVDFDLQVSSARFSGGNATKLRPDAIIHLPGDGHLAIDAKVPMDSYLLAMEIQADDPASAKERAELLARHAKMLRGHVDALVKRNYAADFPDSPQLTILFLPSESLLAEATQADPTLLDYALNTGIVLSSPSSLLALLRAVASVWSSSAASSEAREVVKLGRELVDRIRVFVNHLDKLGKSLGTSVNHYNKAISSLETRLLTKVREFESLDANKLGSPALVDGDSAQIRELRAPEVTPDETPEPNAT